MPGFDSLVGKFNWSKLKNNIFYSPEKIEKLEYKSY